MIMMIKMMKILVTMTELLMTPSVKGVMDRLFNCQLFKFK